MLLKDKTAIVSGVGPGLGREIALALAREGADVGIGARTGSFLDHLRQELESLGRRAVAVPTDITDAGECRALVDATVEGFGRIDVLVHNAAAPDVFRQFEDVDLAEWRHVMDVNLFGSLQLTEAALPHMKARRSGSIVFVSSMIIRKTLPRQGGYAISKAALMTAAQALAKELGPDGIRVNSVVPGWMWGPPVQRYLERQAARSGRSVQEERDAIVAEIPLGEIPPDEDCANAVVFFASELSAVITGQSLDVNGGEVFR